MSSALSVNGRFLDLTESSVPTMTYPGVSGLGQVNGSGSDTITIPMTERNRQIFGDIADLDSVLETTPAFADTVPCTLWYEGNEFLQGILIITGWNDNQIQAQFLSSAANWAESLDRQLKDVNQGVGGAVESRWFATYNVCDWLTSPTRTGKLDPFETHTWIATAYGYKDAFAGANDPNVGLLFSEQRPAAFVYPLIYAHFEQAGYTLVSKFLEQIANRQTEEVLPLALPQVTNFVFAKPDPETAPQTLLAEISQSVANTGAACNVFVEAAQFDTVDSDPAGITATANYDPCPNLPSSNGTPELDNVTTLNLTTPGTYRIAGEIVLSGNAAISPASILATVPIFPGWGGERFNLSSRYISGVLPPSGTFVSGDVITFDFVFEFTPADLSQLGTLQIFFVAAGLSTGYMDAGSNLRLWQLVEIAENDTYDIRDTLPDVTAMQLFAAVVKAFNFKVYTDEINRRVFADPPELFFDKSQLPDLTPQIDTEAGLEQERISPNLDGLLLEWAKDDDDALHEVYTHPQQNLISDPLALGSRVVLPDTGSEYEKVKIDDFAGTFNDYLGDEGGIHVIWLRVPDANPFAKFDWFPRIVQVQPITSPQTLYIQSNEPVDSSCSGSFASTGVGSVYVTPFTEYVRGFFDGNLPSAPDSGGLPGTKPESTLSFFATSDINSYDRYYRAERLGTEELRRITTQLMLNKGRTIEQLIQFNLYWQVQNQIAKIDSISKHTVGVSDKIEANFTILKGLALPPEVPIVTCPLTKAIEFDGVNDTGRILTTDLTTADVQTVGDGLSYSYWVFFPSFPSGNRVYFPSLKGEDPVGAGLQNWRLYNTLFTSGSGFFAHIVGVAFSGASYTTYRRKERRYSEATIRGLLAGKWSHLVLNARRGNTLYPELYIDGVLQTPISQTQDADYTGTEWTQCTGTGASYGSAGLRFSNYYLLNKFADSVLSTLPMDYADILAIDGDFSAADIAALYNDGCGDTCYTPVGGSVVFRHRMDSTSGVSQPDASGNNRPLVLDGMPDPITLVDGPCP